MLLMADKETLRGGGGSSCTQPAAKTSAGRCVLPTCWLPYQVAVSDYLLLPATSYCTLEYTVTHLNIGYLLTASWQSLLVCKRTCTHNLKKQQQLLRRVCKAEGSCAAAVRPRC